MPRTLVDLAESAPSSFEHAWREAQYRNLLDLSAVLAQLDGARRKGQGLVRTKLSDLLELDTAAHQVESPAEFEAIQIVLRAGAPAPLVNQSLEVCGTTRRPDLHLVLARLIVEIDGWDGHKTRDSFEDDRVRDSDFLSMGILTLRFTARRITTHPQWCADRILHQLALRTAS